MKNSLQFSHSEFLPGKTAWLPAIVIIMSIAFISCKRDFPPPCHDGDSFNGKGRAIIVHKGGSIQAAVDAATPGASIFIEAGTYNEAIVVNKAGIHLIGSACFASEKVIIQNPGDVENGISVQDGGDGFVLKNVTIQNFKKIGVSLDHTDNFLLSHVVTINNGEFGLSPAFCKNGLIEYCIATGHPDTGIHIIESESIAVQDCEAYGNVNGFEIENSSDIAFSKNHSYDNAGGLLIVLLPGFDVKTSSNILVADNNIENNNHLNFATSGFEAVVPSGSGILLVGVDNATIKNNKISNNNTEGIGTLSTVILGALAGLPPEAFADIEPNPDGTKIINNLLVNNGTAPPATLPLPAVDLLWDGNGTNNCWKNNTFSTSYPSPLPTCN
ncbi:MAG: parallel beta-helix domain-containing protein [Ginsengibacter sp.]